MSCQLTAIPITQTENLQADKAGDLGRANNQLVHSEFRMELGRFLAPKHKKVAIKKKKKEMRFRTKSVREISH